MDLQLSKFDDAPRAKARPTPAQLDRLLDELTDDLPDLPALPADIYDDND